jgi:hypothetical protein
MIKAAWLPAVLLAGFGCASDDDGQDSTNGTGTITQASCIRDSDTTFEVSATFDARLEPGNLFEFNVVLPGEPFADDGSAARIDCLGWQAVGPNSCLRPQNSPDRQTLHATYARTFDVAVLNGGDAMYVDVQVLLPLPIIDAKHVSCTR